MVENDRISLARVTRDDYREMAVRGSAKMGRPMRILVLIIATIAFLALACDGGGGETGAPSPAARRTVEPTPAASPTAEVAAEQLAFVRDGDIWLVYADGSGERSLNLQSVQAFSWVTSTELDVTIGEEPAAHLLVGLDGQIVQLSSPAGGSWSPDGTRYVVAVDRELVVYDRNDTEVARVPVAGPRQEGDKPRSCEPATLPEGGPNAFTFSRPIFSPDGESVFTAVSCDLFGGATGNLFASIQEVPLDGSPQRETSVQINLGREHDASFSPDGMRFGITDSYDGSACISPHSILISDAIGANPEPLSLSAIGQLTESDRGVLLGGIIGFDWSPESDAIVVAADASVCVDGGSGGIDPVVAGLFVLGADGASEERLVDGATSSPAWSPSGRHVAYVAGRNFGEVTEAAVVQVFDLDTQEPREIGVGDYPAWRPSP